MRKELIWHVLAVGIGGAAGALLRYILFLLLGPVSGAFVSWGTLIANAAGCLILAYVVAFWGTRDAISAWLKTGLSAGFAGGLTTFSTFSMETGQYLQQGQLWAAFAYIILTFLGGSLFIWLGWSLGKAKSHAK